MDIIIPFEIGFGMFNKKKNLGSGVTLAHNWEQYYTFKKVCTYLSSIWMVKDISDFNINELSSKKV